MKTQYTAIVEQDRGWYVAHCVEIPGASGRGPTLEAARESLAEAIVLVVGHTEGDSQDSPREGVLH
jgi:predicted RNase H-like HicB family nuclease